MRAWRSGKFYSTVYAWPYSFQSLKAFCLVVLKAGAFIQYHNIKRPVVTVIFYKPLRVFPVYNVYICICVKSRQTLLGCSKYNGYSEVFKMLPLIRLFTPCAFRNFLWSDYQDFADQILDVFQSIQNTIEVAVDSKANAFNPITIKEVFEL